jgi:hypothetical protein
MAERTGFEPVEERLAPHRFSKPAHSTTLPSLQSKLLLSQAEVMVNIKSRLLYDFTKGLKIFLS